MIKWPFTAVIPNEQKFDGNDFDKIPLLPNYTTRVELSNL